MEAKRKINQIRAKEGGGGSISKQKLPPIINQPRKKPKTEHIPKMESPGGSKIEEKKTPSRKFGATFPFGVEELLEIQRKYKKRELTVHPFSKNNHKEMEIAPFEPIAPKTTKLPLIHQKGQEGKGKREGGREEILDGESPGQEASEKKQADGGSTNKLDENQGPVALDGEPAVQEGPSEGQHPTAVDIGKLEEGEARQEPLEEVNGLSKKLQDDKKDFSEEKEGEDPDEGIICVEEIPADRVATQPDPQQSTIEERDQGIPDGEVEETQTTPPAAELDNVACEGLPPVEVNNYVQDPPTPSPEEPREQAPPSQEVVPIIPETFRSKTAHTFNEFLEAYQNRSLEKTQGLYNTLQNLKKE